VHAVAAVLAGRDQRLVDQRGQQRQTRLGHRLGRRQVEAAPQHRQAAQGGPFRVGEQLPGPVDDRAQAAVPGRDIRGGGLQQIEAGGEPVGDGPGPGGPDPAGGQLQGQRYAVHQPADAHHVRARGAGEAGSQQPGAFGEELDRLGHRQAGHLDEPFRAQSELPPGGHQELHRRRPAEQRGDHRTGIGQMLQVVEHEQQLATGEVIGEQVQRLAGHRERDVEGPGERADHTAGRVPGAHEGHEHRPVAVALAPGRGDLDGQPGLADAAGTDQGDQPAGGVVQPVVQPGQLGLPADQRGQRPRRIRGRRRPAQLGEPAGGGDLLAQGRGGRRRPDAQLVAEQETTGLVLGQGGAALTGRGQEPHQRPVALLGELVHREHPAGHLDAGGGVALVPGPPQGSFQQREHVGPDHGAALGDPLVEQRSTGDAETVEEVTAAQPGDGEQFRPRIGSGGRPGNLGGVHPDRPAPVQGHGLPVRDHVLGQRPAQLGEDQPQVGPGGRLGQIAPEQPGQRRTGLRGAGHGQVADQCSGLDGRQLREWPPTHGQLGRAERPDLELLVCHRHRRRQQDLTANHAPHTVGKRSAHARFLRSGHEPFQQLVTQ
jgi:hypothetical protein